MPTQAKAAVIDEITERFQNSSAAVLTEYRGLTVAQLTQLRRSLGEGSSYAVVKNTLTKRAAEQVGFADLAPLLNGPTAIAFIEGDAVAVAKGLRDFARANPLLIIKGGVLDGKSMTSDEFRQLADLESREVLLAKAVGAMQGVLQNAVSLIAAPLAQTARLVAALEAKKAEEAPADASTDTAAEAPAAEAAPEVEAPAETANDTASDDAGTEG